MNSIIPQKVQLSPGKEFTVAHKVFLSGRPISSKAAADSLFAEVLAEGTALVFGDYRLVICCEKRNYGSRLTYETMVFNYTLCQSIPLSSAATRYATTELQAFISRPLQIELRSLSRGAAYYEAKVSGEVSVRVSPATSVGAKAVIAAEPDPLNAQVLAAADQGREEAQALPAGGKRGSNVAMAIIPTSSYSTQPPLVNIPSRPGLYQSFVQSSPPPKPSGPGT